MVLITGLTSETLPKSQTLNTNIMKTKTITVKKGLTANQNTAKILYHTIVC